MIFGLINRVAPHVIKAETLPDGVEVTVAGGDGRKRAYHLEATDCVPVVEF